jgi:hypothetical protein
VDVDFPSSPASFLELQVPLEPGFSGANVSLSDHYAPNYDNSFDGGVADRTYFHPHMITEHSSCTFTVLESSDRGWQRANVLCSPVVLIAEVLAGVDEGRTLLFSLIRFLFIIWRISILTENDRMALV